MNERRRLLPILRLATPHRPRGSQGISLRRCTLPACALLTLACSSAATEPTDSLPAGGPSAPAGSAASGMSGADGSGAVAGGAQAGAATSSTGGLGGVFDAGAAGEGNIGAAAGAMPAAAGAANTGGAGAPGAQAGSPSGGAGMANDGGAGSSTEAGASANSAGAPNGGQPNESDTAGEGATGDQAGNPGEAGSDSGPINPDVPATGVAIDNNAIYVDGKLFHIRGVNWNPVPKGANHPEGLDYAGFADQDIALMQAAGINAVRTYERLENHEVLDKLYAAGIYVFSTVYGWWQDDPSVVTARVNAAKDHPAIIAWVIGNEWNYNQLYSDGQLTNAQTRDQLNQAAALIKAADPSRPVSTIYGELGGIADMIATMPDIDIWGINTYRGIDHSAIFGEFAAISQLPMYLGEYGADAWDSRNGGQENVAAQAEATTALTQQLMNNYTDGTAGIASGGFIFEWADEWWKAGSPSTHDNGGAAPGGGPYPDQTFNEEYWGIVDIDRNPRPAYDALKALYAP